MTDIFEQLSRERVCTPWRDDGLECSAPADWLYRISCCGYEVPLCARHAAEGMAQHIVSIQKTGQYHCYVCNKTHDSYQDAGVEWINLREGNA